MSGIVGSLNTRGSGLINIGSASDGQVFTGTGAGLPAGFEAAAGGGKILQVVQTHDVTASSQSISDFTQTSITGLNAAITCAATSSKVLIMINWAGESSSGDAHNSSFGIHRDTTSIGQPAAASARRIAITHPGMGYWASDAGTTPETASWQYLDSPSSTSEIVYHGTIINAGAITLYNNRCVSDSDNATNERLASTITLWEVGA